VVVQCTSGDKGKTSVKKGTLDPEWDETIELSIYDKDILDPLTLTLTLTLNPNPSPSPHPSPNPTRTSSTRTRRRTAAAAPPSSLSCGTMPP